MLPPGSAGILSIGRAMPAGGETFLSAAMCHATLTGMEGSQLMAKIKETFK